MRGSLTPLLFAMACAGVPTGSATEDQLKQRARFDLDCDQVEMVKLDNRTRGVRGCGRKVVYVEQCARYGDLGYKENCTWLLNTDEHPPAKAP